MRLARTVWFGVVIALLSLGGTSVNPAAQQETSPEAKIFAIGPQSEIRFSAPWTLSAVKYRNAQELVVIEKKGAEQLSEYAVARVLITTEPRLSYSDALKRLGAIAASRNEPAQFVEIGGWPAVEVKFTEPLPRRGAEGEEGEPLSPEVLTQRAITAIAADDKVVKFDASVLPDAPQGLLQGAQDLARSAHFAKQGNPAEVQKTLRRMQEGEKERQSQLKQREGALPEEGPNERPKTTTAPATAGPPVLVQSGLGELEISASPDANNVVIAANGGLSFSTDRGANFASGSSGVFGLNDPSLGRAQSGNFYLGVIAFPNGSPSHLNQTGCANAVSRSNNGANFVLQGYSALCPLTGAGLCFPDQPHIAADAVNAASGNDQLYAVWRNFTTNNPVPNCAGIRSGFVTTLISCSQDNGVNWNAPLTIDGDFPRVAVGQDGAVYVVTLRSDAVLLHRFPSCASGFIQEDAGFPVTVATLFGSVKCPVPGLDRCNDGNTLSSPTVAPDPDDANHLFVTFAEKLSGNSEQINAVESTNRGLSINFPGRLTVSDTPFARRFMPWSCSTHGAAWVGWYDRRAATGSDNDLTDYFVGATRSTSLMNLSNNPDPQCASGWPCGTRNPQDSERCNVQPQLAGICMVNPNTGSRTPCDFDSTTCPTGETCLTGGGCPKYGDYNGIACADDFVIAAWASATPPPGIKIYAAVIDVTTPAHLTVLKMLEHPDHNHHRLFDLQIDGVTVRRDVNSGSTGPVLTTPGSHVVGERGGTGTSLGAFTTVIGGDCAADGTVNLAEDDSKTCTITNYDLEGGCADTSYCCWPGEDTQGCQQCIPLDKDCP